MADHVEFELSAFDVFFDITAAPTIILYHAIIYTAVVPYRQTMLVYDGETGANYRYLYRGRSESIPYTLYMRTIFIL